MKPFVIKWIGGILLMFLSLLNLQAQTDTLCNPNENKKLFGELYFNYGSAVNSFSQFNRSTFLMGQPLVSNQNMLSQDNQAGFGTYSPWYLPPQPPILLATQGEFKDRIRLSWNVNPLSPVPTGFVIYRDGSFLTDLAEDVRQFLDFNTQAGEYYEYTIEAKNVFGTGSPGTAVGFVNPNGVVSGKISTNSGNPVPGVEVRLTPLTGASMEFDGVDDELCVSYNDKLPTDKFTVSAYVKFNTANNEAGIIDWGSSLNKNWWITTTKSSEARGYIFHIGNGLGSDSLKYYLPNTITNPENINSWHQITMVYNGSALSVMVDGEFVGTKPASISRTKNYLNIGSKIGSGGFFRGNIDDVRIYNRPLTQTEVQSTKNRSVSKDENGLVAYWKMDEGIGLKVFDNAKFPINANIYGVGAKFSKEIPEVYNAGISDVTGYYAIDGINYSTTESFRATPMKNFEFNSAIEFNATDKSYGNLTDFDMPDTATVEVLFHPFDLKSRQTVLSKGGLYELYVDNGKLYLSLEGNVSDLGVIKAKYYHVAVALDNTHGTAKVYLEGELSKTVSFTGTSNWANGNPWLLATNSTNATTGKFYTGLIDEFAIYKTALPQNQIQQHYVTGIPQDSTTKDLFTYFDFNEGSDTLVYDYATINFGAKVPREGILKKANWSSNARRKQTKAHEFEPNVRVVNLNTSNTAVSNIDFKDVSMVNVSGYVRFENTFCFSDSVEILVNGQRNFPIILTDKKGKWSADFEPGKNVKLSVSYKDHRFSPSFYEIRKIQAPKAGIVFLNQTKRFVSGQVAGGDCKKSILPIALDPSAYQVIKIEAANGCFSKTDTLRNPDGKYIFNNLPAVPFEVKYLSHSYNNSIKNYFNNQGGKLTDLRDMKGDTIDFIYKSAPKIFVDTSQIATTKCGSMYLQQTLSNASRKLKLKVHTYEEYYGGNCIVDTVRYTINNDIGDRLQESFDCDSTYLVYESTIGVPNILPPYTKKFQVTANYKGSLATSVVNVTVLGMLSRPATFTTSTEPTPYLILRDPPGDQSTATLEKGTTVCNSQTRTWANSVGLDVFAEWTFGEITQVVAAPLGVGIIEESGVEATLKISSTNTYSNFGEEIKESCLTTLKTISTSADLVGREGDIFAGHGINYRMGLNDRISLGKDTCTIVVDSVVYVNPTGFNTEYIYSRKHIMEDVIPSIKLGIAQATNSDARNRLKAALKNWNKVLLLDSLLYVNSVAQKENISFDAGVVYSKAITTSSFNSLSKTDEFITENVVEVGVDTELPGITTNFGGSINYSHGETWADANSKTDDVTFSYTLADDDIGDNFTVDITQLMGYNAATLSGIIGQAVDFNKRMQRIEYPDELWTKKQLDSLQLKVNDLVANARIAQNFIELKNTINPSLFNSKRKYDPGAEFKIYPVSPEEQLAYVLNPFAKQGNFPDYTDVDAFVRYTRKDNKLNIPELVSPVFKTIAGESMCPREDSTLNREEVSLSVDKNVQINVPKNTPAVYHLKLGNLGSAIKEQDQMTYMLGLVSGTNPRGAVVKVNGFNITQPIPFVLNSKEGLEVTLTIERGPEDFDYTGIKVAFYSECEVGVPNQNSKDDIEPLFYREVILDAHFIEPCSEVDIAYPLQNFVSTPSDLNKISISLVEYDKNDVDLKDIAVQYRRVDGDGAWINIKKFLPNELDPLQTNLLWNTELLRDDYYEIRAITSCNNAELAAGISTIIRGKLERQPPELIGVPEPGDGTWDPGDEISITFNEPIDCDKVIQADILSNNTIGLYDATTNKLVDARISCVGNKIVIVPNINPVFFENRTFRIEVSGKDYDDAQLLLNQNHQPVAIRDKAGNVIPKTIKWEFAVNQNNLEWVGTDVIETNEVLKPFSIERQIRNRGGSIASFRMESIPSWLTVTPSTGTLNPGQVANITLTFQQDLLIGDYLDTLNMVGSRGTEPLLIDYRVRCPQPAYVIDNPSQYEGSMNMVVDLSVFDIKSKDPSDVIVAKIDGKIRGVGRVQYYRNIPTEGTNPVTGLPDDSRRWLTFLTIYGNSTDIDKPIEFHVWDGDKCNEYVEVLEQITYEEGGLVGSPLEPQPIHVLNLVKKSIALNKGFNWVSFNLNLGAGNNTFTKVLASLKNKIGASIKTDDNFANYENGAWDALNDVVLPTKRYLIYVADKDTITIKGEPYNASSFPITIKAKPQWNWLGYVPSTGMTVTQALRGLTPLNGDIIKSQTLFAQYVAGVGWIGNLSFVEPLKGYLLRISNSGNLTYNTNLFSSQANLGDNNPSVTPSPDEIVSEQSLLNQADLEAPMIDDFTKYQSNMNLIGQVNGITIEPDDELRAFVDGKLVGRNKSISHGKGRLFFNTIYFEDEQTVSFKLFKADRNKEYDLDKNVQFKADNLAGLVEAPIVFELTNSVNPAVTIAIEDQIIKQPDKVFGTISIPANITESDPNCGLYAVSTILPSGTETKPSCSAQTLEGSMTSVIKVYFNELSSFVSDQDVLSFVNPATGVTVGCGVFRANNSLFYTTISGAATSTAIPLDVVYFSNSMKKSFTLKAGFTYNYNVNRGTGSNPHKLDFSPLAISVDNNGLISTVLRDTSWIGSYRVKAIAMNCTGYNDGEKTFSFTRLAQNDCSYSFSTPTTNTPVCKGSTITFGANRGDNYSWTGPNGFTSTDRNPQITSASSAAEGVYTLKVTSYGCQITATTNVLVLALNMTVSDNAPLCEGSTLLLTSSGGTTYAWRGPNGFTSNIPNPEIASISPAGSGNYTVVMTNNGCKDSTTTSVLVKLLPVIEMETSSVICETATFQLNSNGGSSYLWSGPNSFSSTLQNPQIPNVSSLNAGIYTVKATLNLCTASATTSLSLKPLPLKPTISGTREICASTPTVLNVSVIPNATYIWSNNGTDTSITVAPTVSQSYTVTATINGCSSTSEAFVMTVNPLYTSPTITASSLQICKGESVILSATCPAVTDIFRWETPSSNNSAVVATNTNNRIVSEPGTYIGFCEPNIGCASAKVSVTITQGANCNGQNFITVTPSKPIICPNSSVTLVATGCSGTLTWFGGTATQTGATATFTPTVTTTYLVQCSTGGSTPVDVVVAPMNVNVASDVITGLDNVKATSIIESNKRIGDGIFTPSPNVTYEAGQVIQLKPGFDTAKNAVFKAEIKTCN